MKINLSSHHEGPQYGKLEVIELLSKYEEKNEIKKVSIDDIVDALSKTLGKYEYSLALLILMYYMSTGFMTYNFAFFLLNPDSGYTCHPRNSSLPSYPCTMSQDICRDNMGQIASWTKDEEPL